jgi:DNA (cytosine-5)-methyltransferase 1
VIVSEKSVAGEGMARNASTKNSRRSRACPTKQRLKFIDLFAGLGGFHLALSKLGHRCVFASEVDPHLAALYEKNFGLTPVGDIREVKLKEIPTHDVLCAGFPCQPFSKAGEQRGLKCPQWGDLIDYVLAILRQHKPQFFIIENVPNLVRHNRGRTWKKIKERLHAAGYEIGDCNLSPHMFGIPQIRERAFIIGQRGSLNGFKWPEYTTPKKLSIRDVLDRNPSDARKLPTHFIEYLDAWQDFLDRFPKDDELPSFPIWSMEFGATYPYTKRAPFASRFRRIGRYRGSFGVKLSGLAPNEVKDALPPYARYEENYVVGSHCEQRWSSC